MKSEDVFILLKLVVLNSVIWDRERLALELDLPVEKLSESLDRIRDARLLIPNSNKVNMIDFEEFVLFGLHYCFPAKTGGKTKGLLTGAKPGMFFAAGLPYSSITVWPHDSGLHEGYEITPLAPYCCEAVMNDSRLKALLAIIETMRIVGRDARPWAALELKKVLKITD